MDNNSVPSFELPKNPEQNPGAAHNAEKDPSKVEAGKEILPAPVQSMPAVGGQSMQVPLNDPAQPLPSVSSSDDSHLIADDNDVIEKEWVDRAKKIIAATSSDPFVEAKELGKLKASYLKKRFNKDIPLGDQ